MSGREQDPGPRGSPQEPQAPPDDRAAELFFAVTVTANTESCGASLWLWHLGHSAFSLPYTRASNWWSHALQTYSKMGIAAPFLRTALLAFNHLKSKGGEQANKNAGFPAATRFKRRALANPGQLLFAAPRCSGAWRSADDRGRARGEGSGTLSLAG